MQEFDKISIPELSKKDMFIILQALEYAGENTEVDDFNQLKQDILKNLSELTDSSEEKVMKHLKEAYSI